MIVLNLPLEQFQVSLKLQRLIESRKEPNDKFDLEMLLLPVKLLIPLIQHQGQENETRSDRRYACNNELKR